VGWFLVRQVTHGTRFDVARYATQEEANEAMAGFEAGYPHHQTYYVEHRYTSDMIEVVSALEAIRRRHEMYVGAGGGHLTDLVFEALCLSLTEAHCGTARRIDINVKGLDVEIYNDGLGVSLEPDRFGIPFAEAIMTTLYACRDHKEHERLKRELCGTGIVVVNALSETTSLSVSHGANIHEQRYTCGQPDGAFVDTGRAALSGTTLRFAIDEQFLQDRTFDQAKLEERLSSLEIDLDDVAITIGS